MFSIFNRGHREQEAAMAREVVSLLFTNVMTGEPAEVPLEVLAHWFGVACERRGFIPDEDSATRILNLVSEDLRERQSAVDKFNDALIASTTALQRMQRRAK